MLIKFNNPVNNVEAVDYQTHPTKTLENGQPNGKDLDLTSPHAILEERKRLAQALHDNLAPSLGYLNLQLTMATKLLAQGQISKAQTTLEGLRHLLDDSYTDVWEEIFNLRLKMGHNTSFLNTLRQHLDKYRQYYRLKIDLAVEADKKWFKFSPQVSVQLIRIIQETLTNIRKHAQTDNVTIRLKRDGTWAIIDIADSGVGFELDEHINTARFGLQIMRERAESIGATLEISTTADYGTRLIIRVPLATSIVF